MLPFSHARFFSSLKQVEERLASEGSFPTKTPKPQTSSIDPSSSPIFLAYPPSNNLHGNSNSNSVPALDFLSSSSSSSQKEEEDDDDDADQKERESDAYGGEDEIEQLMNLLGVSAAGERVGEAAESCGECEFYAKVAGVRGPKCEKERRRLDGWVEYYYEGWRGGGRREPARLAHLLLAKASCSGNGCSGGSGGGGVGFPDTVEEFLGHDPVLAATPDASALAWGLGLGAWGGGENESDMKKRGNCFLDK